MNMDTIGDSQLDSASFHAIADLAYRESGLTLVEEKASMIQSRLRHRLRALKISDFPSYCTLVNSDEGLDERQHLISALTTNVSHFFRENHHFETLCAQLDAALPRLRAGGQMRIWSAGSSNGQEALSTAMVLLEHAPDIAKLDLRILGTDIDTEVIGFSRQGIYPERLMGGVSDALRAKYFIKHGTTQADAAYEAGPALTNLIRYNTLNLLADWPMKRQFDVIFCRNVVIYFDLKTQRGLWPRFRKALTPDGVLFLGHSERIADPASFGFICTNPTTYRLT